MTKALPPPERSRKVLHGEIIPPQKVNDQEAPNFHQQKYYQGVDFGSFIGVSVRVVIRGGKIIHMSKF